MPEEQVGCVLHSLCIKHTLHISLCNNAKNKHLLQIIYIT